MVSVACRSYSVESFGHFAFASLPTSLPLLTVFYSDFVEIPLPEKHAFPRHKYRFARQRVERLAERLAIVLQRAPAVTRADLLRVHTAEYIDQLTHGKLDRQHQRAIGLPWSRELVERVLHSTGATLAAARLSIGSGDAPPVANPVRWAAHLAGGTHHAFPDRGQGFCVLNDVAVAIRAVQAESYVRRALVIDCDVHQGNGTAAIFAGDDSVFTFSIHGAKNFPLRKEISNLDVPLPDGCGDDQYLALLAPALEQAWSHGPYDAVFYIAGADPYHDDKYGRMNLTQAGLRERDRLVLSRCREERAPTVVVMGGGYARDVETIAEIYAGTIEEAALQAMRL